MNIYTGYDHVDKDFDLMYPYLSIVEEDSLKDYAKRLAERMK